MGKLAVMFCSPNCETYHLRALARIGADAVLLVGREGECHPYQENLEQIFPGKVRMRFIENYDVLGLSELVLALKFILEKELRYYPEYEGVFILPPYPLKAALSLHVVSSMKQLVSYIIEGLPDPLEILALMEEAMEIISEVNPKLAENIRRAKMQGANVSELPLLPLIDLDGATKFLLKEISLMSPVPRSISDFYRTLIKKYGKRELNSRLSLRGQGNVGSQSLYHKLRRRLRDMEKARLIRIVKKGRNASIELTHLGKLWLSSEQDRT